MKAYDQDGVRLVCGDCREVMAGMEPESVNCVVTSPPYWSLRKYEGEPSVWGGLPTCTCARTNGIIEGDEQDSTLAMPDMRRASKSLRGKEARRSKNRQGLLQQSQPEDRLLGGAQEPTQSAEQLGVEQHQLEGRHQMGRQIQDDPSSTRNRRSNKTRLHDGASLRDAGVSTSASAQMGVGTSSQRCENRQPDRELRDSNARSPSRLGDVSSLPGEFPTPVVPCPICGGCPHTLDAQPVEGESYAGRRRWQHDGVSRQETPEAWVKGVVKDKHYDFGTSTLSGSNKEQMAAKTFEAEHATCSLCGAWRGQYGLEPTGAMYIEHTIDWLRSVKRVLRPDGVAWIDIGDSRGGGGYYPNAPSNVAGSLQAKGNRFGARNIRGQKAIGIPAKSLCLIPQRLAIACQEDGWIVRNVVQIKARMPESAADRMTRSYRTLLVLTKSNRPNFWWNEQTMESRSRPGPGTKGEEGIDWHWQMKTSTQYLWEAVKRSYWHGADYWWDAEAIRMEAEGIGQPLQWYSGDGAGDEYKARRGHVGVFTDGQRYHQGTPDGYRNCDDLWTDIPPAGWPSGPGFEHFATFAVEEPERCIKASCPAEVCVKCGKARRRVLKKQNVREHPDRQGRRDRNKADYDGDGYAVRDSGLGLAWDNVTVGWTDCGCGEGYVPGTVLDPFIGTGTTAVAARLLGRRAIGIDISRSYIDQAITRLTVGDKGVRQITEAARHGQEQLTLEGV